MDILIIVSSEAAGPIVEPLARACSRANCSWGVFFTHCGVKVAASQGLQEALSTATVATVCHESWDRHMDGQTCPVEAGSQTNNSLAVAEAARIVSL